WSAGIACYPTDAGDATVLMECADAALYSAKAAGTGRTCGYDPTEEGGRRPEGARREVEAVLGDPEAVVPVFQPIGSLSSGEITEHENVADEEGLRSALDEMRRRGARIAIDDAGAGYSGLQQVMRLQPDIIKLDRSLVGNVDSDPAKAALIDSFVRFARRTDATIVAEGIQTAEELKVLADL